MWCETNCVTIECACSTFLCQWPTTVGSLAAAAGLKLFYSFYSHFVCYSKAWFASVIQQRGTQRIPQRSHCGSQFYIVNVTLLQLCLKGLMVSVHENCGDHVFVIYVFILLYTLSTRTKQCTVCLWTLLKALANKHYFQVTKGCWEV